MDEAPAAGRDEAEACRHLWISVILLAFKDLTCADRVRRDAAHLFFERPGDWFREVCGMAGFDPEIVRGRGVAVIAQLRREGLTA